jgi:F-type H+-transporting ATPase subunit delta
VATAITIARPYAKAAFEYAYAQNSVAAWQQFLAVGRLITADETMQHLLRDPKITADKLLSIYKAVAEKYIDAAQQRFLSLLVRNKRLNLLPDIEGLFQQLRAQVEKTQQAEVVTTHELSGAQQDAIKIALKKRLQRDIQLVCRIDESILGGAIIRAGDMVIDGSVRSQLVQLQQAATQ